MENDFFIRSILERLLFDDIKHQLDPKSQYDIYITDPHSYSIYDVVMTHNLTNFKIFIEIKVRDNTYGEYFLETKKYNSLINLIKNDLFLKEDEFKIIYLNFTNNGVYLWNITNPNKFNKSSVKMNKATSLSRTNKINKNVYLLPISDAKFIDYKMNKIVKLNEYYKSIEPKINNEKSTLDDFLFG